MPNQIQMEEQESFPIFGVIKNATENATEVQSVLPAIRHNEATVIAYTTFAYGGSVINMTVRQGVTPADIDGVFDAIGHIRTRVFDSNGLFVTTQNLMYLVTDDDAVTVGMKKVPMVFDSGPETVKESAKPSGAFAPDEPFVPKQYQQAAQAPQPAGQSDLIVFPVDNIQWAGTLPSKSKPGEFLTTFRVFGGPFKKFGVVCYPEAMQKADFDIGGAGAGWGINLEGQGWTAHALPGEGTNAYGNPSPKKVLYFSKAEI